MTSHDAVNKVRKLFKTKQVGHTGTLDPLATGLLVVLVGRAVKASEYLLAGTKRYKAGILLGVTTDTEDVTGNILERSEKLPTFDEINAVLPDFTGDIMQIPPMYSALKTGGKKLYELARKGITVEREPRPITVSELSLSEESGSFFLTVTCSHGTYIRTLCADIGAKLGCGAVMQSLERLAVDRFSLADAKTLEELENMTEDERNGILLPVETAFQGNRSLVLPPFYEKLCKNGNEIYLKKIGFSADLGENVNLFDESGAFYALAAVREYPDGIALKSLKRFDIL